MRSVMAISTDEHSRRRRRRGGKRNRNAPASYASSGWFRYYQIECRWRSSEIIALAEVDNQRVAVATHARRLVVREFSLHDERIEAGCVRKPGPAYRDNDAIAIEVRFGFPRRCLGRGEARTRKLRGPVRIGRRRRCGDREIERQRCLAGNAFFATDEPLRLGCEMRGRAGRRARRYFERDRQQDFTVVSEVVKTADIEALWQRPFDLLRAKSGRQCPGQRRRQARVAWIDPVRMPVRLVLQQETDLQRLAGRERCVLADQRHADVIAFGLLRRIVRLLRGRAERRVRCARQRKHPCTARRPPFSRCHRTSPCVTPRKLAHEELAMRNHDRRRRRTLSSSRRGDGKLCREFAKSCHGSLRNFRARFIAAERSKAPALLSLASSSQRSGIATGAPWRARSDQLATLVAPRVLRSQSMKMRPSRFALLAVAR